MPFAKVYEVAHKTVWKMNIWSGSWFEFGCASCLSFYRHSTCQHRSWEWKLHEHGWESFTCRAHLTLRDLILGRESYRMHLFNFMSFLKNQTGSVPEVRFCIVVNSIPCLPLIQCNSIHLSVIIEHRISSACPCLFTFCSVGYG